MNNLCLLFPGQGSQKPGMGLEVDAPENLKNEIWEAANEAYADLPNFPNLRTLAETGTADELAPTEIAQPVIAAVSLIHAKAVMSGSDNRVVAGIGHSLGEYPLFAAAGIITVRQMFGLIKVRARAMNECCESHPGAMAAVMGADPECLHSLCTNVSKEGSGFVSPVNYNSDAQTVIAGETAALEAVIEVLADKGIRTVRLPVSGAFHTPLMKPAANALRKAAAELKINPGKPAFDVYSNITGERLNAEDPFARGDMPNDISAYLSAHMISPVRFTDEVRNVKRDHPDAVSCEFGKTLSAMIRKIKID
jgi:[acyl-carrier-protein] S-malonyltransferase